MSGAVAVIRSVHRRPGAAVVEHHLVAVQERPELLDADAEQVAQRARVAARPHVVVLVDDAGEVRRDQVAAAVDERRAAGRPVAAGITCSSGATTTSYPSSGAAGGQDVGPDPERQERGVPVERLLPVAQRGARVGLEARAAHDDSMSKRIAARAGWRRDPTTGASSLEVPAQPDHRPVDLAVLAGVRHHRRVVLLRAGRGLPPLEEADGVGAVRHVGERVPDQRAVGLGRVDRAPVDRAGRVLHQEPGPPAGEAAGQVGRERQLVEGAVADQRVVVVGDEVDLGRPVGVVDAR